MKKTVNAFQLTEKIKRLVKARLLVLPPDALISIGSYGSFTKTELISHVEKDDDIGKIIIGIEMDYLKSLKQGIFYA